MSLPLAAQGSSPSQPWLRDVKPGVMVQFHVPGHGRVAGPLVRVANDSVVMGPAFGYSRTDTAVALAGVDSAWLLKPRSGTGLLMGGAVGGLFGFFIASQQLRLCPPSPGATTHGACVGNRVGGVLIGGAIGAVVGWLIGSSDLHWVRHLP